MVFLAAVFGATISFLQILFGVIYQFFLDNVFNWLKALIYFYLIDVVMRIFLTSQILINLQVFIIYILNAGLYKILPETGVAWITNCFIFFFSLRMLLWIMNVSYGSARYAEDVYEEIAEEQGWNDEKKIAQKRKNRLLDSRSRR